MSTARQPNDAAAGAAARRAARAGARNLLDGCLGLVAGNRLLIIAEGGTAARSRPEVRDIIAAEAEAMGLAVEIVMAPKTASADDCPQAIADAIAVADGTVFLGRLGDQMRFVPLPGDGAKAVCYLPDADYLADPFGRTPPALYREVEARIRRVIAGAAAYRITCPLGTDVTCRLPAGTAPEDRRLVPFSVRLFPEMIFPPLTCKAMSGRLALSRWLTSSSTNAFEDSVLVLNAPVTAVVQDGRITGFEGDPGEARRVERHFIRVGRLCGGDAMAVNSWHTGINPRTFYKGEALDDPEHWGDIAYGSPRFTHFHACGADPGDIAIAVFDATIAFDGEVYWRDGNFVFLDRPDMRQLLSRYPGCEDAFDMRRDIGI